MASAGNGAGTERPCCSHVAVEGTTTTSREADEFISPLAIHQAGIVCETTSRNFQIISEMNWTGGSLQRTKNANKGTLQKQKAYFARARTQLQNDTNRPTVPFRPNYLCRTDDVDLAQQSPSFGSGSIRHTGHSVRRRDEHAQQETLPAKIIRADYGTAYPQALHRPASRKVPAQYVAKEQQREASGAMGRDIETQLLDANRRRLLGQQDWIGIAASKPAALRFVSRSEKDRIGKRKRVRGRFGAVAQSKPTIEVPGYRPQSAGGAVHPGYLSGPTQNGVEKIQIQIGTNALTSTYSSQVSDAAQSHPPSDCMLFDEEGQGAQPDVEPQLRRATTASQQGSRASLTDVKAQRGYSQPPKPCSSGCLPDQAIPGHYQMEVPNRHISEATGHHSESTDLGYRITHHVQGIERPLRLVFGGSNSSASDFNHVSSLRDVGESPIAQTADHAGISQRGHMHQDDSDNDSSIIEGRSAGHAVVDENRWRGLLAISDGCSSHSTPPIEAGNSVTLRPYPAPQYGEAVANWSQHATQGDRTHISSPGVSASLPSSRRPALAHQCAAKFERRGNQAGTASRGMDEDERLWQGYVFGSDDNSMSESTRVLRRESEHKTSGGFGDSSSRFLPFSAAVSSVSSTPFRLISGPASCISDSLQDRTTFAPPSGTRTISPAALAFAAELSDGKEGATRKQGRVFGEESVTHASLQNNASFDTDDNFSRFIDDTRTSRSGLDRPDRTRGLSFAWAEDGTQEHRHSLFTHKNPDEWSDGLDLVDPNSLT